MSETRTRARLSILSDILSFPTIRNKDWIADTQPITGDLVSLSSAPASKWYLSWFIEITSKNGFPVYLLESVEDGQHCEWSNVSINVYSRERVAASPEWRWNDAQFALFDRWIKVLRRKDAYSVLGRKPEFDGNSIMLSTRIRYSQEIVASKTWLNWKKLTMREMGEFYDDCVKQYNETK